MSLTAMGTISTTVIVSSAPDLSGNFVCDGTADEVEINAARAYVNALGGGTVIILQGTYITAAPITGANNVGFEGIGRATLIQPGAAVGNAFTITGFTDVFIRNLAIDTKTSASTGHGVFIEDGADYFDIFNVTFIDSDADSIKIEGTNIVGGKIHDNIFLLADINHINVQMDGANTWKYGEIYNNVLLNCLNYAIIVLIGPDGVIISDNICQGNKHGIAAENGISVNISDNVIIDSTERGISLNDITFGVVSGNVIEDAGTGGILLNSGADNFTISGNIVNTTGSNAIDIFGLRNVISNNHITSSGNKGISSTTEDNVISGNNISLSDQNAISVEAANCVISDNLCYDNGQQTAGTYHEIQLSANADRCIVSDNNLSSPGDSSEDCIHLDDGATQVSITGNYCYNGMGSGITLTANNDNCLINGNLLHSNDDYGVEITAATCNDNRVLNNQFISNGILPVLDNGTDSIFHGVEFFVANNDQQLGNVPGKTLTNGQTAYIPIHAPCGMQQLMSFHIHVIPQATQANANWDLATDYGAIGEAYNTHSETEAAATYNVTNLEWFEVDALAAGMLAAFGNGDSGGISLTVSTAGHNVAVVFGHLSYV